MIHIIKSRPERIQTPDDPAFWILGSDESFASQIQLRDFTYFTEVIARGAERSEEQAGGEQVDNLVRHLPRLLVPARAAILFSHIFEGGNPDFYLEESGSSMQFDEAVNVAWYDSRGFYAAPWDGDIELIHAKVDDTLEWSEEQRGQAHAVGATTAIYQLPIDWSNASEAEGRPTISSDNENLRVHFGILEDPDRVNSFRSLIDMPVTSSAQ